MHSRWCDFVLCKQVLSETISKVLHFYCNGEKLELESQAMVQVRYHDQEAKLPLLVVKETGPSLLRYKPFV